MHTINSVLLLETLREQTRAIILQAEQLNNIPAAILEENPSPQKWSVAQILEHLNIYCRYYLDAIEKNLHHSPTIPAAGFKPGWLGNYFTKMMQPAGNGSITKKMKAPANALPASKPDAMEMLHEFIRYQHQLLNLLQIAKEHNINKSRIPISIARIITLKLGDTFRFVIAHQQRHFIQIGNIVAMATSHKKQVVAA